MSSPTVNTTNNGMMEALLLQQRGPPPIPFKSDCSNKDVTARDQYVLVHLSIDTRSEAAGTFEQKVKTFANGTAKEYIRWKLAFANVIRLKPLETGMAKIVMANVLLTGAAKDAFGSTLVRAAVPHPEDSPAVDEALYNSAIEALNNRFIPLDGLSL